MDRQTLRDWVHPFNASGPDGLIDNWTEGPKPRLSEEQLAAFIVEAGPDREKDGVVRQWAKRGARPRQPADQRYDNAYLFGAICPPAGSAPRSRFLIDLTP
jgi:hypothetical protein